MATLIPKLGPRPGTATASNGTPPPALLDRDALLRNGIFGFEYQDPRTQTFVLLRSLALRKLAKADARLLAITSSEPQNGKSFVAANLAAALGRIHPACLVDLDLRRPVVAERFGLTPVAGVDDYLRGHRPLSDIAVPVAGENLTIVPVAEPSDVSADLLAGERAATLFSALRALPGQPVCILDTPPILEGDDMMIIARHVDAVLLVIEEGRTRQRELREVLRLLGPTPLLGTVLNKSIAPLKSTSYGYYRAAP